MSSTAQETTSESCDLPSGHAIPRTSPEDVGPLSRDTLFELLKNRRRRDVLRYLRHRDEMVTLSDLAEHVAALENDIPEAQLSSRQRKRVYVALYQCHLPILARADVIEFNQARGHITRTERADQLYPYLDDNPRPGAEESARLLGLAAAGGLAYTISAIVPGLTVLAPLVVGIFVASVAGLAVYQLGWGPDGSALRDAWRSLPVADDAGSSAVE